MGPQSQRTGYRSCSTRRLPGVKIPTFCTSKCFRVNEIQKSYKAAFSFVGRIVLLPILRLSQLTALLIL